MGITVQDFIALLRRSWRFLLICGLAGSAAAFSIFRFWVKPVYVSTVKLYVAVSAPSENGLNDLNYAQKIVNTCIELLKTDNFFRFVKESSGVTESVEELRGMTEYTVLSDTEVFEVRVSSHGARHSRLVADTIGRLAPNAVRSVEQAARLRVVDPADLPEQPAFPNLPLDTVMGFLLGVVLAALYALLKSRGRITGPAQTAEHSE